MKQPGVYEHQLGIAHCTKKNILIFNTSPSAHCPVYVVSAKTLCNEDTNTDIPICLAYDQSHYEALVPDTDEDIMRTIMIKQEIINGTYSLKMKDVFTLSEPKDTFTYAEKVKINLPNVEGDDDQAYLAVLKRVGGKCRLKVEEKEYKKIMERKRSKKTRVQDKDILRNTISGENDQKRLEDMKNLGGKQRSKEEEKEYKKFMERKRSMKLRESDNNMFRETASEEGGKF